MRYFILFYWLNSSIDINHSASLFSLSTWGLPPANKPIIILLMFNWLCLNCIFCLRFQWYSSQHHLLSTSTTTEPHQQSLGCSRWLAPLLWLMMCQSEQSERENQCSWLRWIQWRDDERWRWCLLLWYCLVMMQRVTTFRHFHITILSSSESS